MNIKYILFNVTNELKTKFNNFIAMESAVARALKLGNTKIIGKCIGVNPSTGQQIIFSQDTVEIYVIPFGKIKIKTPLEGLKSGAMMPAAIWGKFFYFILSCVVYNINQTILPHSIYNLINLNVIISRTCFYVFFFIL